MIQGLSGSLLSHDVLGDAMPPALRAHMDPDGAAAAQMPAVRHHRAVAAVLGPVSTARAVFDLLALPLLERLGFRVTLTGITSDGRLEALLEARGVPAAALLVTSWTTDLASAWRDAVHHGIGAGLQWCVCINGRAIRIVDARRTYSRRYMEFELPAALVDPAGFAALWGLVRADAFAARGGPVLSRAVALSEEHRVGVRASLQQGVHDALVHLLRAFAAATVRRSRTMRLRGDAAFEESLTVVYRILFLLFAEARGLVPQWHPTYRDGYTIESLRRQVERQPRPPGVWEALQAIARLAHRGCEAGALRVPPFNGRLFSPVDAPLAEVAALDDGAVRQALLSLTTRPAKAGRERISYADLGVEQLGGVYERVLDFTASNGTLVPAGRRKATGSFYTPRSLTEYVVRRTLAPLVREATPDGILALRVLDPAMGSGAFLVAACRYLAAAYETALVREGVVAASDLTPPDRAGFRRAIAQRCLFGVDINPMAVQLGRLSLWLATLSGDRPLTFLDHHLRVGNSLAGASLADVARQPPPVRGRRSRPAVLPLFDWDMADGAIRSMVGPRLSLAHDAGDTIEQVRGKERLLASLLNDDAPLARWKAIADLWCSGWFDLKSGDAHSPAAFGALVDERLGRQSMLPPHTAAALLATAASTARRERFFHWTLEFPEVFYAADGSPLDRSGFDAVIGNPPWEMLRADDGSAAARTTGAGSSRLTSFARSSGTYRLQGDGHANLYQLFLERSLSLVHRDGRIGVVLPSGFALDHGCASLRRHVLDKTSIDSFVTVENRDGLFPIHRGLKFLLITATIGPATTAVPARSGVRSADILDALPDTGADPSAVRVPRSLIDRMSPLCAIPEITTAEALSMVSAIAFSIPALGHPDGWQVSFGRELNASDDRPHFVEEPDQARHYPVVEGKQVSPFAVDVAASRLFLPTRTAPRLLNPGRTYRRPRLAYRDVASATNRLTLIAAIIPAAVVTTHTLFCLREALDDDQQHFLCGVFNSFVANYLVRMRVSTHVGASVIEQLPVPRPPRDSIAFTSISTLARTLTANPANEAAAATLQASVAHLYGLDAAAFAHVLATFPLIDPAVRAAALNAFSDPQASPLRRPS